MLRHSKFDPEEIEREKGVILEEMNMYQDTPRDYIGTVYETLMFGDNPLGWETLGTKETIKAANRETFIDYVDEWYTPERMVVGVSGMVGDDLAPRSKSCSATWPARRRRPRRPASTARPGPRVAVHHKDADQAHLFLGVPSLPLEHPDRYALQMLVGGPRLRDVLPPLPRGARAPRARLLRPRDEPLLHRRRLAARAGRRRPHTASTRRSR